MFDAKDFQEQFADFSKEELVAIKHLADDAIEVKDSERYNFLRDQLLIAFDLLSKEFPCSEIIVEDYENEFNLMNYKLSKDNFHR